MKPDYVPPNSYVPPKPHPAPNAYSTPHAPGHQAAPTRSNTPLILGIVFGVIGLCFVFVVLFGALAFFTVRASVAAEQERRKAQEAEAQANMRQLEADLESMFSGDPIPSPSFTPPPTFDNDQIQREHERIMEEQRQRMDEMHRELEQQMKDMERDIENSFRPPGFPR